MTNGFALWPLKTAAQVQSHRFAVTDLIRLLNQLRTYREIPGDLSFGILLRRDYIFYSAHVWPMPRRLRAISPLSGHGEIETLLESGRRRRPVSVCACRLMSFNLTI